jgi:hypothetical protein
VPGPLLNGSATGPFSAPAGQLNSRPFGDGGSGAPGSFSGSRPISGAPMGSGDAGPAAAPSRGQQPVWSDLIGGTGDNGVAGPPTWPQDRAPMPQDRAPLPHRRPTEPAAPDGMAAGDGTGIPRQRPVQAGTEDGGPALPQAPVAPQAPFETNAPRPVDPALAAPPAWPPVPKQAEPEVVAGTEPPQLPTAFAAALDMTAEMPRVRVDWEQNDEHTGSTATGYSGGTAQRFADETMELPIFQELESAWFRKPGSPSNEASPANEASPSNEAPANEASPSNEAPANEAQSHEPEAASPAPSDRAEPPALANGSAEAPEPSEEFAASAATSVGPQVEPTETPAWQTAADEGWKAASVLDQEQDFTTTATGLPKRVPMSQLVPGGVEKGTVSAHKRTPEAVRGLLSAYHRGVQRGRSSKSGDAKTPEHTAAGPQSSQGGKEQEA